MNRAMFLTIAALLGFLYGLAFVFVPAQLMALYGTTLDPAGQWLARYLGAALIGIAAITWLARTVSSHDGLRAVMLGGFVVAVAGLAIALLDRFFGVSNAMTWVTVAVYLFLTVGFGYFQFASPQLRALG